MAAPNTNPSDRATDAALRQVLNATRPIAGCDVDLAAAYAEGRLHGTERRRVESHLAECAACRRVATELLEEGTPQAPVAKPAPVLAWWRWQWAVPALAGVVIIGSVVFYQREQVLRQAAAPVAARQVTQVDGASPPVFEDRKFAQNRSVLPPQQPAPQVLRQRAKQAVVEPASPRTPTEEFRAAQAGQVAEAEQLKDGRDADESKPADELARANKKVANAVAPPAPQAAPAAPQAAVGGAIQAERDAAGARRQEAASFDKEKSVALLAGRLDAAAPAPLPEGVPLRALARDGARLWAVSDGGRIFRSTDAGRTWARLASPTTADLVAVRWDAQARTLTVQDRNGREYRIEP
jgi:hypothetical protein